MPDLDLTDLSNFLKQKAKEIESIEAEAAEALHSQSDQGTYRALMAQKAELLANLADDAEPLLSKLQPHIGLAVGAGLQKFSNSARNALNIGSVFYMSALLFPEDHAPGAPNDLDNFIARLDSGEFS